MLKSALMKKVKLKKRPGMTIMCFDDSYELTEFCYNWMVETINTISPERIFIPAGKNANLFVPINGEKSEGYF